MKRKAQGQESREMSHVTQRPRRRQRSNWVNRRQRNGVNEALSLFTWRY